MQVIDVMDKYEEKLLDHYRGQSPRQTEQFLLSSCESLFVEQLWTRYTYDQLDVFVKNEYVEYDLLDKIISL